MEEKNRRIQALICEMSGLASLESDVGPSPKVVERSIKPLSYSVLTHRETHQAVSKTARKCSRGWKQVQAVGVALVAASPSQRHKRKKRLRGTRSQR